jgi:hypothetical protein
VHDVVGNSCLVTKVVTGDRLNGLAEELRTNSTWSTQVPVAALMSRPRFDHDSLTHPCEPSSHRCPRPIAPVVSARRFPAPWRADKIPGRYIVGDANQRASARVYLFSRDNEAEARQAKVPTKDEARRIAVNVGAVAPAARGRRIENVPAQWGRGTP